MKTTLHEIWTDDQIKLEGILFEPERKGKTALIFIHGLTGTFYGGVKRLNILAEVATKNSIALASFNTRGHDIITSAKKIDRRRKKGYRYKNIGAGQEVFEESVFDIKAVVDFLKERGYKKIFLVGHSTGANKAVYYISRTKGRGVTGVALLGPVSDIPGIKKKLGENYTKVMKKTERLVKRKRGDTLMSAELLGYPVSAQRLLSLGTPGGKEDVFQYHLDKPRYTAFKKIKKPLLIVFGEEEQYVAPYTLKEVIDSYRENTNSHNFSSVIIPGADHSFTDRERELAKTLVSWVKSINPK